MCVSVCVCVSVPHFFASLRLSITVHRTYAYLIFELPTYNLNLPTLCLMCELLTYYLNLPTFAYLHLGYNGFLMSLSSYLIATWRKNNFPLSAGHPWCRLVSVSVSVYVCVCVSVPHFFASLRLSITVHRTYTYLIFEIPTYNLTLPTLWTYIRRTCTPTRSTYISLRTTPVRFM